MVECRLEHAAFPMMSVAFFMYMFEFVCMLLHEVRSSSQQAAVDWLVGKTRLDLIRPAASAVYWLLDKKLYTRMVCQGWWDFNKHRIDRWNFRVYVFTWEWNAANNIIKKWTLIYITESIKNNKYFCVKST